MPYSYTVQLAYAERRNAEGDGHVAEAFGSEGYTGHGTGYYTRNQTGFRERDFGGSTQEIEIKAWKGQILHQH